MVTSNCDDDHSGHSHLTTAHTAHGLVMAIAALCFFPTGAFIARNVNLDKEAHMGKLSFNFHRTFQILGVVLVIAGVSLAFTMVGECHFWSSSQSLLLSHGILGVCIVALLIAQAILGFLRPSKDSAIRQRWATAHKLLGHSLVIGMMVNSVLGATKLIGEGVIWPVVVVSVGAVLWQLAFLALQVKHRAVPSTAPQMVMESFEERHA